MNAIRLGDPNLFVKGIAEATFFDPDTGNIIGFDSVASENAITSSVNLQEVAGGLGNALVGVLPDTTRLSGTYTSQAFSLKQRQMITGGKLNYGAVSSVCETVTAADTKLTVSRTPAKHYGQSAADALCWCYVREHGASTYMGTNYGIDPVSKEVNFVATPGTQYDVFYFTENASAQALAIPASFSPTVMSVQIKYGVYAKQNNAVTNSTLQGWLYVIVPRAIPNGDAGVSASQTANSTTDYAWMAISSDSTPMACADCGNAANNLAYYVFVPCDGVTSAIEALAVIGSGVSVKVGGKAQIPVVYIMPDNSIQTPVYSDLTFTAKTAATATVDASGMVTGVAAGESDITVTLAKADGKTLTTVCNVTVTA